MYNGTEACRDCGERNCVGWAAHYEVCDDCEGVGGYDNSRNCEIYDDWDICYRCEGSGEVSING